MLVSRVRPVTESMIGAVGLRKSFGSFEAVRVIDVDLRTLMPMSGCLSGI